MASTQQIFNKLVADTSISIKTKSRRAHDNLRIRLVKLYSRHKNTMRDIGYDVSVDGFGVCASYSNDTGLSVFTLNTPRKSKPMDYQIVETEEEINNARS